MSARFNDSLIKGHCCLQIILPYYIRPKTVCEKS